MSMAAMAFRAHASLVARVCSANSAVLLQRQLLPLHHAPLAMLSRSTRSFSGAAATGSSMLRREAQTALTARGSTAAGAVRSKAFHTLTPLQNETQPMDGSDAGAAAESSSTGGKQYKITNNDVVTVNRLEADVGRKIVLEKVLLVGCTEWTAIGKPLLSNKAQVLATVTEHYRDTKVQVFKKKRRKGYARRHGHRQELTTLRIDNVTFEQDS